MAERQAGRVPDHLLLLQHDPVFTLGRNARQENVLFPAEALRERGFDVFETGRGGDVTYHGPGQVVGYPIIDLSPDRRDVHRYVRDLEEVMMRTCADYGVEAGRVEGLTGAWVGRDKIGAIGVRIARWVTSHGFAFNVATDLSAFDLIVPCGIRGRGVTSLERLLGRPVPIGRGHGPADLGISPPSSGYDPGARADRVVGQGVRRPESCTCRQGTIQDPTPVRSLTCRRCSCGPSWKRRALRRAITGSMMRMPRLFVSVAAAVLATGVASATAQAKDPALDKLVADWSPRSAAATPRPWRTLYTDNAIRVSAGRRDGAGPRRDREGVRGLLRRALEGRHDQDPGRLRSAARPRRRRPPRACTRSRRRGPTARPCRRSRAATSTRW